MKRLLIFGAAWCAVSLAFAFGWAASQALTAPNSPHPLNDGGWADYRASKMARRP